MIFQILEERARGRKVGLSVLDPKGEIIKDMKSICDVIGEEMIYIDPEEPDKTDSINVMQGDKHSVAEATVAVLKAMFGKQEAFFQTVQETSARNITLLLKELYGDRVYITHVLENLRNESVLKKNVQLLKQKGTDDELVDFFENELLNGKDAEKYRQLVIGLRAQLENITSNEYLRPIITRPSSINLDDHFEKGGILGVNTALGLTGKAGDAFGQFIAMHLQLATFRRKGTERTRVPHYLIIDEYSRYINPDVERFLSIAAEYRVALIAAIQSLGQIEMESGMITAKAMKQAILTNCRNKIIFGGLSAPDAKELATELGKDTVLQREKTFDGEMSKQLVERSYRESEKEKDRFKYTTLMDGLPRFHYIHKLLMNGHPQKPGVVVGSFTPRGPEEIRKHFDRIKRTDRRKAIEEELNELRENPPPIWKIGERYKNFKRKLSLETALENNKKKSEEMHDVLSDNPFKNVTTELELDKEKQIEDQNEEKNSKNDVPTYTFSPLVYVKKERSKEERSEEQPIEQERIEEQVEEQVKKAEPSVVYTKTQESIEENDNASIKKIEKKQESDFVTSVTEPLQDNNDTDNEDYNQSNQDIDHINQQAKKELNPKNQENKETSKIKNVQKEKQVEANKKEENTDHLQQAPTQDFWDKLFQ